MKEKKYHIIILVCLVVILCNAGIHLSVIEAQKETIQRLHHAAADARDRAGRQDQGQARTNGTGSDVRQIINTIAAQIPDAVLFTLHASRLRDLVERNRLDMDSSLVFRPADAGVPYLLKFDTRINALGDYPRIKNLIADILNQSGLICLNSLRLERESREEQQSQGAQGTHDPRERVRLILDLSMFFQQGKADEGH